MLDPADAAIIDDTLGFIRAHDTRSLLRRFGMAEEIAAHCKFSHAAVLVFPDKLADLQAASLVVGEPVSSVVVRDRLSRRYGQPGLRVVIVRAEVPARDGEPCEIEIFAATGAPADIVATERERRHESHVALEVLAPDPIVLSGLTSALGEAGLVPDGGGYNQHVDATVLYFRGAAGRLELISTGHHPRALTGHLRQQPAYRLLQLMTGAWATQAIAVAAELRLADHLTSANSTEQVARATGTDHDSLCRLLRYLASLGVLRAVGDTFEPTELGQLLADGAEHSLRPLALLYGGPFYESFGQLGHAVRTGRESFEHRFGKNHFDYFAERPELNGLFNRGMAASASMFGRVAELVDFSTSRVVVDIAGGNGELLGQILRAEPHLRGVLFERAHVIEAARSTLADCLDRCDLVVGDFTSGVPQGGDVYLLSRVLHDWDDQQCQAILKRCAESMSAGAELLIVERLLPPDSSPSLAVAWDVHMLCNVGGRERTADHYRQLLAEAGFTLTAQHDLPLDVALLRARLA